MFGHYTHDESYVPPINEPHAYEQWEARTPAEISLEEGWRAAIPVHAPECNATFTRLYAPYNVLFVVRDGLLRTELNNDGRIDTEGLSTCPSCEELIDPLRAEGNCPWCDAVLPNRQTTGGVTLVTGGAQR
ncbi:hypothetical protein [Halorubrum sp. LN27]|uniref:hypothetical protein n=1 Tax=Halorubrum sp. LN27 TaxID=2801032 RepID=UPI00190C245C|nr:hypothetical protein [Halorubrum sp. LN27]